MALHIAVTKRARTALVLILALALLVGGCAAPPAGSGSADTGAGRGVVVVMGPSSEPAAGFDPAYGWGAGEHVHEPLIQSTLTVTGLDLRIEYDLATDLAVSEDGLTWTAVIREDARFTDGEPLTAADVAFTYNTVAALSTVNDFTMLERAEATDEHTVVFHLRRPYSIWPYSMANVGILPAHAYGPDYGQNPIGSGRYRLVQWDKGQQVILEANPDYYGEAPLMERVTVLFMGEDAAYAAVQAGQADLAYTAVSYTERAVAGYALLSVESVDNRGLNLPALPFDGAVGNDVTADPAIRRAINLGLDREALIAHVLEGHGTPAWSVCDKLPWFYEGGAATYDPDGAAALLEAAGWLPGADGIRERDGVRAALNILYPASDSVRQAMAAEICNQLARLGIAATYEGVGWDTAYERAQREPLLWGWGAHTPMELYNLYHTQPDTGLALYTPYANAGVDALMDEALQSAELEESYRLWREAQAAFADDLPWVWLANVNHLYWVRDGLQVAEQKIHPHGHGWSVVNNVDRWSWS